MTYRNKAILVGRIVSSHGINGAVKIHPYTEEITSILGYKVFFKDGKALKLRHLFTKAPNLICQINNIKNRNDADQFIGLEIFTDRDSLPKINDSADEFYIADLVNLPILDKNNNEIGRVENILNYGAGDLIEVKFMSGESEILQFTKSNFPVVEKDYITLKDE